MINKLIKLYMDIQVKLIFDASDKFAELVKRIVNTVDDVINRPNAEVLSLPKVQEQVAKKTPEPVKAPVQATAPVHELTPTADPASYEQVSEPKSVDLNSVQSKVAELVKSGRKVEVQGVLKEFGVTGYSQLQGDELTAFYNRINAL